MPIQIIPTNSIRTILAYWLKCTCSCQSRVRDHPAAQKDLARLEKKHDKGQALTILAQKLARAVYYRLKRPVAFDRETFFQREGRGTDEPGAELDNHGLNLHKALAHA